MEIGSRRMMMRETSPDRAKVCVRPRVKVKGMKKLVQVVYYLSRNGQLEHPHYIEVAHFSDQPLRLKDVMERLTMLRGKGMPSLYSWSCKRSYKNGYVWNDLAENDTLSPAEGAEYVLKGSELLEGCSARLQQIHMSKPKGLINMQTREVLKTKYEERVYDEELEEFEYEEKTTSSHEGSTTPRSRCSRGVSTDELEEPNAVVSGHHEAEPSRMIINDQPHREENGIVSGRTWSGRHSVLLQLIACGSQRVGPKMTGPAKKELRRGVLRKSAAASASDEDMIRCMSENPRFGSVATEEKEYFSGSIVESMTDRTGVAASPVLVKSNSYNEERSGKAGLEEEEEELAEEKREKANTTGKCMPRKIFN